MLSLDSDQTEESLRRFTDRVDLQPGGDFRISGTGATSNEFSPAVVADPIGGLYLVVWQDARGAGCWYLWVRGRIVCDDW